MSTGTPQTDSAQSSTPQTGGRAPASRDPAQSAASQAGQAGDVGECPAEPLEAFKQALDNGDADEAWNAYTSMGDADRSQLNESDISRAVGLFYPAHGLASIQTVFADFCIEPMAQLEIAQEAAILDAELADLLINAPGNSAEQQVAIAHDAGLMATLVGLVGGSKLPHELFAILSSDPVAFIGACMTDNPLSQWVDTDDDTLKAVTDAVNDYVEWSRAFEANGAWDRLLKMAGMDEDSGLNWWIGVHLGSGYGWIVEAADKPIADDLVPGLWALYDDGIMVDLADKYKTWECLYRCTLNQTAQDLQTWQGTWSHDGWDHTRTQYYHGVAPNDDAMNLFFTQYKQIPRVQIDLASTVIMTDYRYYKHEKHKPATYFLFWEWNAEQNVTTYENDDLVEFPTEAQAHVTLGTSYYTSDTNAVLMHSLDGVGTPSTGVVPDSGTGAGRSGLAVNDQYDESGNRTGDLNFFQNHATHEIGHAVGNKRLVKDGIDDTGDNAAKTYANWQKNGNAVQYARQLGWTVAMDGTTYSLTVGATTANVSGSDIRTWIVSLVGGPAPAGTNGLTTNFAGSEMTAVKSDATLAANTLVLSVESLGASKGNAYSFLHGIPNASSSVHFFSTRWDNAWVTYNKSAWDEKASHYSVSSFKEMFAEIYTSKYTGGPVPAGMQAFFNALDSAEAEHFPDEAAGGAAAPGASEGAHGEMGPTAPNTPWPS